MTCKEDVHLSGSDLDNGFLQHKNTLNIFEIVGWQFHVLWKCPTFINTAGVISFFGIQVYDIPILIFPESLVSPVVHHLSFLLRERPVDVPLWINKCWDLIIHKQSKDREKDGERWEVGGWRGNNINVGSGSIVREKEREGWRGEREGEVWEPLGLSCNV